MKVVILDAQKVIYEGIAKEVVLPGEEGELAVLDFHQTLIARLKQGIIRVSEFGKKGSKGGRRRKEGSKEDQIPIKSGIAKMQGSELTLVVES